MRPITRIEHYLKTKALIGNRTQYHYIILAMQAAPQTFDCCDAY